jgi:hypothetical protein
VVTALRAELARDHARRLTPKGDAVLPEGARTAAADAGHCPAWTLLEEEQRVAYCDREIGHHGSHHAGLTDDGEVAWSDDASVTL